MFQIPQLPPWDAMHPLVIHFPIVLLLIAPLIILASAIVPAAKSLSYKVIALAMLLLGTASLFMAASSGEEAAEFADRAGGVETVLSQHQGMAERCEIAFSILTGLYVLMLVGRRFLRWPESRAWNLGTAGAFLVPYAFGLLMLVNTAHAGGRLVHEYGVHAMVPTADTGSQTAAKPEGQQGEQDKD